MKEIKEEKKTTIQSTVAWVDTYILPVVGIIFLLGFAGYGVYTLLPNINEHARLTASIFVVSIVAVKAFRK